MRITELIEKVVREVLEEDLEYYVENAIRTYMEYIDLNDILAENLKFTTRVEAIVDSQIEAIVDGQIGELLNE